MSYTIVDNYFLKNKNKCYLVKSNNLINKNNYIDSNLNDIDNIHQAALTLNNIFKNNKKLTKKNNEFKSYNNNIYLKLLLKIDNNEEEFIKWICNLYSITKATKQHIIYSILLLLIILSKVSIEEDNKLILIASSLLISFEILDNKSFSFENYCNIINIKKNQILYGESLILNTLGSNVYIDDNLFNYYSNKIFPNLS